MGSVVLESDCDFWVFKPAFLQFFRNQMALVQRVSVELQSGRLDLCELDRPLSVVDRCSVVLGTSFRAKSTFIIANFESIQGLELDTSVASCGLDGQRNNHSASFTS